MTQEQNFGSLGKEFQIKLISQIIYDRKFGLTIVPIIEPNYFGDVSCKLLVSIIKNYNKEYENTLPTKSGLKELLLANNSVSEQDKVLSIEILKILEAKAVEDALMVQDLSAKFCRQQEILKAMAETQKILSNGDFENADTIVSLFQKASEKGIRDDNSIEVDHDLDSVLEEDYRNPIPTGIAGLDAEIGGGLGKGEFGFLLMPTSTGKSTMLSKIANTAYKLGYNVLQIFFEDKEKDIQRKHCSALTHFPLNDLHLHKQVIKDALAEAKVNNGKLILKKYPSDSTTVFHIKQQLRLLANRGIKIDMLIVDYVDCLVTNKYNDDALVGEGAVIRQLESLCGDEDIALWSAVQTNRQGVNADVVDVDMIQGSFKRAQVGHLIISVSKSQEQKQQGLATMAVIKSRFGDSGKVFKNMIFRNDTMYFDTTEQTLIETVSLAEDDDYKNQQNHDRAVSAMNKIKKQKEERRKAEEEKKNKATE